MVRFVYIHQDGTEFETDSFEEEKVERYMAALRATPLEEGGWLLGNGIKVRTLPDLPPPPPPVMATCDPLNTDIFRPHLRVYRRPNIFQRLWWRILRKWYRGH